MSVSILYINLISLIKLQLSRTSSTESVNFCESNRDDFAVDSSRVDYVFSRRPIDRKRFHRNIDFFILFL